jgi:hypothetical protein
VVAIAVVVVADAAAEAATVVEGLHRMDPVAATVAAGAEAIVVADTAGNSVAV